MEKFFEVLFSRIKCCITEYEHHNCSGLEACAEIDQLLSNGDSGSILDHFERATEMLSQVEATAEDWVAEQHK